MLNQPMSSPMMTTMFGFAGAWALAGEAASHPAASTVAAEAINPVDFILSLLAACPELNERSGNKAMDSRAAVPRYAFSAIASGWHQ